jgi:hypothetical protein
MLNHLLLISFEPVDATIDLYMGRYSTTNYRSQLLQERQEVHLVQQLINNYLQKHIQVLKPGTTLFPILLLIAALVMMIFYQDAWLQNPNASSPLSNEYCTNDVTTVSNFNRKCLSVEYLP